MPPKRMNLMLGKYLLFGTSMISYISVKRELDNTINILYVYCLTRDSSFKHKIDISISISLLCMNIYF